jgi:hypothetical protein
MVYRTRIKYTAAQRAEIWDRWQRGESLNSIGRLFDRPSSSVFNMLAPTGGIRPPPRQRSRLALTLAEREEIFLLNLPMHAFVPLNAPSAQRASKQDLVAFVPTVVVSLCDVYVGRRTCSQRTHRHVCVVRFCGISHSSLPSATYPIVCYHISAISINL